ncbi:hypothetical protein OIY81_2987 [Cryptosporidium canis]|uniref:Uncharacterized protein n=1 Tax=Cryptosporidium canis TaxID=195482 RepID=A0ABQ8P4Q8_9CRYT|nr:hypothetical protein OJ252_2990 [Cryptosporidium canis]KAJ1607189.1 hypothetical protein OIY81_2987 [Cryptosporidium canis]
MGCGYSDITIPHKGSFKQRSNGLKKEPQRKSSQEREHGTGGHRPNLLPEQDPGQHESDRKHEQVQGRDDQIRETGAVRQDYVHNVGEGTASLALVFSLQIGATPTVKGEDESRVG